MIKKIAIYITLLLNLKQGRAQQNWAAVPCFDGNWQISSSFVDSLHNEIILNFVNTHQICNVPFKGVLAYNGSSFHDLDYGLDTHDPTHQNTAGDRTLGSIFYNGKTLFGGFFSSVGTNTLHAEAMALWNGAAWDSFPKHGFDYNPTRVTVSQEVYGFLRDNGKLWIYGEYENLGGVPGKCLYTFDGNTFTPYTIPVSDYSRVHKLIKYHNKIIAAGSFNSYPSSSFSKLAMYDDVTGWSQVGNGVFGNLAGVWDMAVYRDTLYIAGVMAKSEGNIGNYIMKWDGAQLHDAGFGGFYGWGSIRQLVPFKNRLYAFGNFTYAADQKAFGVAYYENGQWTVPQDSIAGNILNAEVLNDELYITGAFVSINGDNTIKYFAKLRCPDFDATCVTGLQENSVLPNINVYPNPTKDKLNLEGLPASSQVLLSNVLGQRLYSGSSAPATTILDLNNYPAGIYYLTIKTESGGRTQKIIKE